MANNLFDIIPEGFFLPFTNQNKRINYDLLQLINHKMSLDNLQVTKEEIVDWIFDYLNDCPIKIYSDDSEMEISDIRSFAFEKLRYFVRLGWLIEDTNGIKTYYQLDENGIKILSLMDNLVKEDTSSLEFSGYVYNIYNSLYYFNLDHSVDIIEQAYGISLELNSKLRGLNVNIKKYLEKLIRENEAMPHEILETLFYEYQKKVVVKAFSNFREKDNPSKYKIHIIDKIDDLTSSEEKLNKMINNYIMVKYNGMTSDITLNEGRKFFLDRLYFIRDQFENIEEYIQMLDNRNAKYIMTTQSRLNFLLNEESDMEGRLIETLKGFTNVTEDFFDDEYFDIFVSANIDEKSLYNPVSKSKRIENVSIEDKVEIDQELLERLRERIFRQNIFSVNSINKYAMNILIDNKKVYAKDIKINSYDDFLKIFLIPIYSTSNEVKYKVKLLDDSCYFFGYKMSNYILERKN